MTHSPLHSLRPQPLQSPVAFPPSTHAHTSAAARLNIHSPPPPLPSSPLSTTRMPSSLEEPHNYFLWETYCSRSPLSLITIKQKRALTGGTRRAALMLSAAGPSAFFSQANGRALTCQHHPEHPASYSLTARRCKAWCLCEADCKNLDANLLARFFSILLFFSGVVMLV